MEITCLNLVTIFNILIENFEKISKRVRLIETVRLIEKVLFFEIVVYIFREVQEKFRGVRLIESVLIIEN